MAWVRDDAHRAIRWWEAGTLPGPHSPSHVQDGGQPPGRVRAEEQPSAQQDGVCTRSPHSKHPFLPLLAKTEGWTSDVAGLVTWPLPRWNTSVSDSHDYTWDLGRGLGGGGRCWCPNTHQQQGESRQRWKQCLRYFLLAPLKPFQPPRGQHRPRAAGSPRCSVDWVLRTAGILAPPPPGADPWERTHLPSRCSGVARFPSVRGHSVTGICQLLQTLNVSC